MSLRSSADSLCIGSGRSGAELNSDLIEYYIIMRVASLWILVMEILSMDSKHFTIAGKNIAGKNVAGRSLAGKSALQFLFAMVLSFLGVAGFAQNAEKISFDTHDSTNGYYIAVPPVSNLIKGVVVLFCNFRPPEKMLPETKLHNVAAVSDLLTVYASLGNKLFADTPATDRISAILNHVVAKYKADTASFVLGGFGEAGAVVLRYTELAYEYPDRFAIRPRALFGVSPSVDLLGFYHLCERQIKKNASPPAVGDARFFLGTMNMEQGTLVDHAENYKRLTPFDKADDVPGNERFLKQVALRLYYDDDINWQLTNRQNSLYDTNIPDGTELINRLLLAGDTRAELVLAKQPGMRSNGIRSPYALSIMDETDCIQWIKKVLHLFDPNNPLAWVAPYRFIVPDGWRVERLRLPGPFVPHVTLRGMEDIRFPAGWADPGSGEYWSVAYLFMLDGGQKIDRDIVQTQLKVYFDDLVPGGLQRRGINFPADKIPPAIVKLSSVKTEKDDVETYSGTIDMLDYMAQKPMTLNCRVHVKECLKEGKTALFVEISPREFGHPVWKVLRRTKEEFGCEE
jgi:hypothetical protein